MSTSSLAAPATTYWAVSARNGDVTVVKASLVGEYYASMSLEGGKLMMRAAVPATNRTTAIAAARIAWRDLAANLEGGM